MLRADDMLGRYRVLARMRAGGMATLYLAARDGAAGFARAVAIKVIHPHLARDEKLTRMFIDEATLASKVDHPCVVRTEELGQDNGRYYLVLEYVDGCSLSELMRALGQRKRRLAIDLAARIALDIASGLHAAHDATDDDGEPLDIVHRDVSPQNVLLAFKGHVKLIDFGLAKTRDRLRMTAEKTLAGKLAYMPPEQARAEPLDRRADVYALGVVLWEMLTMRRLFEEKNEVALLERVRNPKIEAPSTHAPDISKELDRVVLKALSPNAEDRYPTAEAFRVDLVKAIPQALERSATDLEALLALTMEANIKASRARLAGLGAGPPDGPSDPPAIAYIDDPPTLPVHRRKKLSIETFTSELDTKAAIYASPNKRFAIRPNLVFIVAILSSVLLGSLVIGRIIRKPAPTTSATRAPGSVVPLPPVPPSPVTPLFGTNEPEPALELPPTAASSRPRRRPLQTRSTTTRAPAASASSRVIMIDGIPMVDHL